MVLKDYIKKLQELEAKHGGDLLMISASDDEGNDYNEVHYDPTAGNFKKRDREWQVEGKINSVCVN